MDKEKNIIDTVKKVADNKENQVDSGLGNFLKSLIEVQAEERYRAHASFKKHYEEIYKANKK
jgi:hypothetical protein